MHRFLLMLVSLLTLSAAATAQAPLKLQPMPEKVKYTVAWNGIRLGRVIITANEVDGRYAMQVDTKTRGLAELFARTRSYITTEGVRGSTYVPTAYNARKEDDDGTTTTLLQYDAQGSLLLRKRTPPDDPAHRPVVPLEELKGAADPITAFLDIRQRMFANLMVKKEITRVRTYDGRRLGEFTFKAVNRGTKMIHDDVVRIINTVLTRKPIHGYTEKELKKYDKGDPRVHVYFSENAQFMPLAIEVELSFGSISVIADEAFVKQQVR